MSHPAPAPLSEFHFGAFVADLRTGELRKHGIRVKLQDRPFLILTILLECPGEVITRDEMRSRMWPDGTFVDFDHSISSAIRKLRDALGDSAATPRYVETVGRRGYRFIYPVSGQPQMQLVSNRIAADPQGTTSDANIASAEAILVKAPSRIQRKRWLLLVCGVGAPLVAVLAVILFRGFHAGVVLSPDDHVVLADIENNTGNAAFDHTLVQAMRIKLNESPFLNLVPDAALRSRLEERSGGGATSISAREACRQLGAQAVIGGTLAPSSSGGYTLQVSAQRCIDGRVLIREQAKASSPEQVLPVLGQITDDIRRQLGEPAGTLEQFHTPMVQATTASVAALKAFSLGEQKRDEGKDYEAIPFYSMAVDLDPGFALAYARLGAAYNNAQESTLSDHNFQKAFENRERCTERERLYLTAHYYNSTGDLQKTMEAYQFWREIYPRDVVPWNNLGDNYLTIGQPEKAVESLRQALRLKSDNGIIRGTLCQAYQRAGLYDEAKKLYDDTVAQRLDGIHIHFVRYLIAFAENDTAEMQRELDWARGNQREGELLDRAGWAAASRGEWRRAHSLFSQARRVAIRNGLREFAAAVALDEAQLQGDLGLVGNAKASLAESLRIDSESRVVHAFAALVSAQVGELRQAEELAHRVIQKAPHDTLLMAAILPSVRGVIDLKMKKSAAAIEEFRKAEPFDLARATEFSTTYYRGLAYLEVRDPDKAIQTFQEIIDHRAVAPHSLYLPLANLGLARAHRLAGDMEKSRRDYEALFAAWSNADSDIPLLRTARYEYSQLPFAK